MQINLLLQISLKEKANLGMWNSANKVNYVSADDALKLLSFSDLFSLFQLVIILVHFVLTVYVKITELKIYFSPNYKKYKKDPGALQRLKYYIQYLTVINTVSTVHNS